MCKMERKRRGGRNTANNGRVREHYTKCNWAEKRKGEEIKKGREGGEDSLERERIERLREHVSKTERRVSTEGR